MTVLRAATGAALLALATPVLLHAQRADSLVTVRGDSISVRFVNAELRAAVQALGRHIDRPIVFGALEAGRITLETPAPVPRSQAIDLLEGVLESHGYELVTDSAIYRVRQVSGDTRGVELAGGASAAGTPSEVRLWIIRLQHARASDVAATVNALYGQGSALGELGARRSSLNDALEENRVPAMQEGQEGRTVGLTARPARFAGDVTIVPDAGTNSLLVRASRRDFDLVEAAVEQLDLRPLQVLIEVLIAEVRRDRRFAFGVDLTLDTTVVSDRTGATAVGSNTGLGLGDFVLEVMKLGGGELNATLRAAAGRGDVSIVSRPVLLAANNEDAEILVGSQRPFVQVSRSLPTDVPSRDQVIQYRDVGTKLTIHPTISADGYVMLDVLQEVNAATTETAFDAPVISTRTVRTRLLVRDGQTAVLGGLNDRQEDNNRTGIPILSSIPLIGGLFGSSSRRSAATELLVFLTPRVIQSDEDLQQLTEPLQESAEKVNP